MRRVAVVGFVLAFVFAALLLANVAMGATTPYYSGQSDQNADNNLVGASILSADAVQNAGAPQNALEAIAAALANDPEITAIRTRENNFLGRLSRARVDPRVHPDAQTGEIVSSLCELWEQSTTRCYEIAAEVLSTLMAIDTELHKQVEYLMMYEELSVVLDVAEMDFRMSRITSAMLDSFNNRYERVQRDLTAVSLRLNTHNGRYRELTGFALPLGFDFKSAWLVTDVNRIGLQPILISGPVTLFAEVEGIAVFGGGSASTEPIVNRARIDLIDLHDAVRSYAAADRLRDEMEALHVVGEISLYQHFEAVYSRLAARVAVHERKQIYATAMLELDKSLSGLISSRYRAEPVLWFYEHDWVYEGRQDVSYDWAEEFDGWWKAVRVPGGADMIELEIIEPCFRAAAEDSDESEADEESEAVEPGEVIISRATIYYNGRVLANGRISSALRFLPPAFDENSLMEVVFAQEDGTEVCRAYIDGFMNAGRFFNFNPRPDPEPDTEEQVERGEEEAAD